MLRCFFAGFSRQLASLVRRSKYRVLLLLFLAACGLSLEAYQQKVVRDLTVAVVDLDQSRLSRTVRHFLQATPEVEVSTEPLGSVDQARERLVSGKVSAVVVIPDGFAANVKGGKEAPALVAVDYSNIVTGKTAYKAIAKVLGTVGAGAQLTYVTKLGEPAGSALARVAPITVSERLHLNPATNFAIYVGPPTVFFFLNVLALLLVWSVFLESSAAPLAERLGRLSAVGGIAYGRGLLLTYGLLRRASVTPQSSFAVVSLCLGALLITDLLMAAAIARVLPSPLLAFQLTVMLGMVSLMLSGVTWPLDMFPAALRHAAELMPFTPFAQSLRQWLHEPVTLAELSGFFRTWATQAALYGCAWLVAVLVRAALRAVKGARQLAPSGRNA